MSDAEIVALVSAAVHEPFREPWRRYEEDVWLPLRRTLKEAAAAHERALAGISPAQAASGAGVAGVAAEDDGDPADATGPPADGADALVDGILGQYRSTVSDHVIRPLRTALAGSAAATSLEESLASTADRVRASLAELPALIEAPVSRTLHAQPAGTGAVRTIKRACARALAPVLPRGRVRSVPAARLARQHLDQVVLRAQARAFRESQRARAAWLGHIERAWAHWIAAVFNPSAVDSAGQPGRRDRARAHRAAGAALHAELQALQEDIGHASGRESGASFELMGKILHASVAVAGTFAADPPSSRPAVGRQRELARRWDAWAEGAASRLELYRSLAAMRRDTDGILRQLHAEWGETVREADSLLGTAEAVLRRGRGRAETLSGDEASLAQALATERERTDVALARVQDALPDTEATFETMTAQVEKVMDGLDAMRSGMPDALALHDIPEPGTPLRKPAGNHRTVRLREVTLQAFDTLRRERIRTAPTVIREALHRARSEVGELREVSGFGYDAAIAELTEADDSASVRPVVLAANGLLRAGAKAAAARDGLHEALAAAETRVAHEVGEGSQHLIEQVTADRVTAGYLGARTYLTVRLIRGWQRWRGRWAHAGARLRAGSAVVLGLLRRLAGSLGIGPGAGETVDPPERTLAYAEEVPPTLPVVYRRLFALEPLTDPRLLAGRDDALAEVAAAWTRQLAGEPRSLIVIASPGAGVTSFLNICADRLSEEAPDGVSRAFRERVRTEARLADCLATWLGLEEARDLDALAHQVMQARPGAVPRFAVLEGTEHLHMRTPGGSKLFERLLTFMSRTESRVFWVAAMTRSAWQLVEKRAPAFVHDIERVRLRELSPDQLKAAILARHRLSGLPLRYAEPRDRRAVLRRRTRRLRGTDRHDRLIEADYFQRLHRAALGSTRLALFHWLRSADFTTVEGSLVVQPLRTLSSGMKGLDLAQSFALKAILDHGTLTVAEYCEIARASGPESMHLFRSLEDHRIVERLSGASAKGEMEPGHSHASRYRIRPLMTGAVTAHLRSRNILH